MSRKVVLGLAAVLALAATSLVLPGVAGRAAGAVLSYSSVGDTAYRNPVYGGDAPDPDVVRVGATYYAYTTAGPDGNIPIITSTDLAHWSPAGDALPELPPWSAPGRTWAPSVVALDGQYVMYYSTEEAATGFECISWAVSPDPLGPFVDRSGGPFICQRDHGGSIDPFAFVDADGQAYLYWKTNNGGVAEPAHIWGAHLAADGSTLTGPPLVLLGQDQPWESTLEAPDMVPLGGGAYDLFFSGGLWNSAGYGISFAICNGPLGPCGKPGDGPLVRSTGPVLGPGGESLFTDTSGNWWMAYDAWTAPATSYPAGGVRSLRIDRVSFRGPWASVYGPSWTTQFLQEPFRVAGADRFQTAADFATGHFSPGVPVAYVATGYGFADALAAGPAAAHQQGPILLTARDSLPGATATALVGLNPGRIVVLGGRSAVSDAVLAQLAGLTTGTVTRLSGADRYSTAAAVAAATFGTGPVPVAYVATGHDFPDALTGAAAGGRAGGPVLLVDGSRVPSSTGAVLARLAPARIVVLGGPRAVPDSVLSTLRRYSRSVVRVAGGDRYATSAAVANSAFPGASPAVLLATGSNYPDALTAASVGQPVLLVPPAGVYSPAVTAELADLDPSMMIPVGGPRALPDSSLAALLPVS